MLADNLGLNNANFPFCGELFSPLLIHDHHSCYQGPKARRNCNFRTVRPLPSPLSRLSACLHETHFFVILFGHRESEDCGAMPSSAKHIRVCQEQHNTSNQAHLGMQGRRSSVRDTSEWAHGQLDHRRPQYSASYGNQNTAYTLARHHVMASRSCTTSTGMVRNAHAFCMPAYINAPTGNGRLHKDEHIGPLFRHQHSPSQLPSAYITTSSVHLAMQCAPSIPGPLTVEHSHFL